MPIIAKSSGDGASFTPAPAGVHRAVCVDVIDKGIVEVPGYDGKAPSKKHMVSVAWQIDEERDDGKRFVVYRRYNLSLNEKAALRKDLESWRGRPFTREEEMGFDVETVIGANCLLNIQHNVKGDKTYANVASVMPLMKGMPKLAAVGYVRDEQSQETHESTPPPAPHGGHGDAAADFDAASMTDDDIPF